MVKRDILRMVWSAALLLVAWLFWRATSLMIAQTAFWPEAFWGVTSAFVVLVALCGLVYALENSPYLIYLAPILVWLPWALFWPAQGKTFWVLVLAGIFFFDSATKARLDKVERLKVNVWRTLTRSLGPLVTAIALLVALLFFSSPMTQSFGERLAIPRPLYDALINPMIVTLQNENPEFRLPNNQVSVNLREALGGSADAVYEYLNEQINILGSPYKIFIPVGIAISFFFLIKLVGSLLSLVSIGITVGAVALLRGLGLVKISQTPAVQEKLVVE